MPRPREFDPDFAAQKAMELFWRKGYAATSVRDLVDYTGVAHAGLYSEFGDKDGLFVAALKKYADITVNEMLRDLETNTSGRSEIVALFKWLVEEDQLSKFKYGCMLCNAGVEISNENADVRLFVLKCFNRMVNAMRGALERAKAAGEIDSNICPDKMATVLVNTVHGLALQRRAGVPIKQLKGIVQSTLKQLD